MLDPVMGENAFRARDIGLRAQKKILSRMASKNVAKAFIDDNTASLLDNVYRLAKQYTNNKKEAEKLIKNIIKIVIKIAVLQKNGLFSSDEIKMGERFKTKFHTAGMTIISFYEVDYTFDQNYLISALNDSQSCLMAMVAKHLTEKSLSRIESVFQFFMYKPFLNDIFHPNSEHREVLGRIVADLNTSIEQGNL